MKTKILVYIGLITGSMYFYGCKEKVAAPVTVTESIDSLPRLMPGDACYPKSSFNPECPLICYYNSTINAVFFESKGKKGKFGIGNHGQFVTFYPHNSDSIFFMYNDSVILYNSKGQVLKSIYYQRKFTYNNVLYRIGRTILEVPNLSYDPVSQTLFLPCSNSETNWWDKPYFKNSMLIVGLDIKTDSITYYPIKYPAEYTVNCYGELSNCFYTLKDNDKLYLSFNALPSIYEYRLSDNPPAVRQISPANLKNVPQYDSNYREDLNLVLAYQKRIDTYWKIMYDPFRKLFYRFHTQPTLSGEQKAHGSYPANFDVILIVYDENFNELKRFNFGDSVNHYGSFISDKGLHLKMFKPSDLYEYFKIISISG